MNLFADIIVPLPVAQTYTYSVPEDMQSQIDVGMRVIVHFGVRRFYTGIVVRLHTNAPEYANIKPISTLIDEKPILLPDQLRLWQFVSQYYMALPGEIYKCALPSAMKLESESTLSLVPEVCDKYNPSKAQMTVIEHLSDLSDHSVNEFCARDLKPIRQLLECGVITKTESVNSNYKPKFNDFIALDSKYLDDDARSQLFISLSRAKKQLALVKKYTEISNFDPIERKVLLERSGISASILRELIEKGVFVVEKRRAYRIDVSSVPYSEVHSLSASQHEAYEEIKKGFSKLNTVLLHGVTSSGKTEIYIRLIKDCISSGRQVLMLVPEVGLTQQLANRMKQFFGGEMGIYHSFCSSYERVETYQHLLSDNPYMLILGVRSSIFLPFRNLGLIIVDEEHDMGYKQIDPSPRYNARDTAIYLASLFGAKTLLGTATPSVDSYSNCHTGKYALVELNERYGNVALPQVHLVDLGECYRKRQMKGHFSLDLIRAITQTLNSGHQVILFQNRRGFSPYVECHDCGYVPKCPNCDVSLTYHRFTDSLVCHYCGHTESMHRDCPSCGRPSMSTRGFGTEQLEEEASLLFPECRIARLDLDTSRSPRAFDAIVSSFQSHEVDILIGTQMVAKGLDFDNVGLVGVLNADNLLYHPDFRAYERAYQMLVQVAGRTGRRQQGQVIIQSSQTDSPIIGQILRNDYKAFFADQMTERCMFHYPPYYRLIRIVIRHSDQNVCNQTASVLTNKLRLRFHERILGPEVPPIGRIQNRYINQILLKVEVTAPIVRAKEILQNEIQATLAQRPFNTSVIQVDVDPI